MSPDFSNHRVSHQQRTNGDRALELLHVVVREVFAVSLITYFTFFLIERLIPRFVSRNLSLTFVLIIVAVSGLFTVVLSRDDAFQEEKKKEKPMRGGFAWSFSILLGLFGTGATYLMTRTYDTIGVFLAFVVGAVIVLCTRIFLGSEEE